jgi:N-acetylneuraminic acid mutarotase
MKALIQLFVNVLLTGVVMIAVASSASAHFLWLKSDSPNGRPQAVLVFGESAADEAYHLPESLADTEIWCRTPDGERAELKTAKVENDDRIGLVAPLPNAERPQVLEATREYGVYGDFLLTYYAKHIRAKRNDELAAAGPSPALKLDVVPKATEDGLELTVLWDGKPRADVDVNVKVDGENEDVEAQKLKTDADGKITIQPEGAGLVAALANVHDGTQSGELGGKKYTSAAHYATLTFPWSRESRVESREPEKSTNNQSGIPPLPEPVSSFGAAVCEGYLYVYSGHTGTEHDHSAANLSQHFRRVPLSGGKQWELLPIETPLQGLALVAHGGKLYRVGGMNARNATTDDKEDLRSTTEFAEFDPATKKWTALAPLPAPRSSHNAVVIGERLYVTGGWTLDGSRKGEWLDDSLVYDFTDPSAGWQKLPKQGFQRRALAASQWRGKLAALGGMDQDAKVSRRVDFFDPATGEWSEGPELPGTGMSGFGVSAWNLGGNLYVSGFNGRVFKLADDGSEWEKVAKLAQPRFFHQLVPAATRNALLVVGGASRDGHLADVELIDVSADAVKKSAGAGDSKRAADTHAQSEGRAKI